MINKTILKNKLRIITIPMKNAKTTSVLVLVGAGSKYETKSNNGISHFLEHMFFKGTKKRSNTLKISETLDRIGGKYNAFTGKEYTGYWAKVSSDYFDTALDWVSDILLNSQIKEQEINKERGVIIEEMNMYLDTPMIYIDDLWEQLLYGNQPAGWLIIGEKKNILKFKRKDFLNCLKQHYTAENTIICVAGNINKNSVENKIKKYFKNINTAIPEQKIKTIDAPINSIQNFNSIKQTKPECLIHFKKTDQTHLTLGFRGYDLFSDKKYAQTMLATILGGFMSSRLFISVREKNGLAYRIKTLSESSTDTGYLATFAGIRNDKVEKAIELILKEYKIIKNKKISKQELEKTKNYLKGSLALSLESSDSMAFFHSTQELLTQKILTQKQINQKIDTITQQDILQTAKNIFIRENLNLALIGPFKDKTKFKKIIEKF
ncbi:MAG: pitrilysin family protein [Patescibacteria group bacterium]|nr:pitrilysin family protein [Patescibacteria group bacterium]